MNPNELITKGLGLPLPWQVVSSDLHPDKKRADLQIDFIRGSTFPCPACDRQECKVHDTRERSWRTISLFEHKTYLHARVPRVICPECGVHQVDVPWSRPDCGFTDMFEAWVLILARSMPVNAIAHLVEEHDTRLWTIILHHTDKLCREIDYSAIRHIGIDEKSVQKNWQYITTFIDLDTGRPVFVTEGRDSSAVKRFSEELVRRGADPAVIEDVCCDMSPAYISGVEKYLPQARITFDKFHLTRPLNDAVDEIRKQERDQCPELKNTRFIWGKNVENLSEKEKKTLQHLEKQYPHLNTIQAYQLRLDFQNLWQQPPHKTESYLNQWYDRAVNSGLKPIEDFAATVKNHWNGILNWFKAHISNGILEGTNSLIKSVLARARNFRTTQYLGAAIYLITGNLEKLLPTQNSE